MKKGYFGTGSSPNESELLEEEFERTSSGEHPQFDAIFLGNLEKSDGLTKNVTFTIAFQFELKKNSPTKIEKLPQKLERMFVQGNEFSDVRIKCDGRIFDCHKTVLSCQSEVFKGNFNDQVTKRY